MTINRLFAFLFGVIVTLSHLGLTRCTAQVSDLLPEHSQTTRQWTAGNDSRLEFNSPEVTRSVIEDGLVVTDGVQIVVFTGPHFGNTELTRLASHKTLQLIMLDSTSVTEEAIESVKQMNAAIDIEVSHMWATELLRQCCGRRLDKGMTRWQYNPNAMIDAVNYLRLIPRSSAIEVLRQFISESTAQEQKCLTVVIPLAFSDKGQKVEALRNTAVDREILAAHHDIMFLDIHMEEDIPFDIKLMHQSEVAGSNREQPPRRSYLVDWAALRPSWTREPLRPSGKPMQAAQRLFRRLARTGRYNAGELTELERYLKSQAGAMDAGARIVD